MATTVTLANVRFDVRIVAGASKQIQTCWMTFSIPVEWLDMSLTTSYIWQYYGYTLYPTANATAGSGYAIVHVEWPWLPINYDATEQSENDVRINDLKTVLTDALNASFESLPLPEKTAAQEKIDSAVKYEQAATFLNEVANVTNKTLANGGRLSVDVLAEQIN